MTSLSLSGFGRKLTLPSPLPEYKPITLESVRAELMSKAFFKQPDDAISVSFSGSAFRNNLEKHIDDVKFGKGNLSKKTANQVSFLHQETTSQLNNSDPEAATSYSAYSTTFSYGHNLRFKTGVNEAAMQAGRIKEAVKEGEEKSAFLENFIEVYSEARPEHNAKVDVVA